jgi:hypothetical protein
MQPIDFVQRFHKPKHKTKENRKDEAEPRFLHRHRLRFFRRIY